IPPWVIPVAAGTKTGGVTDFTSGGIEADVLGTGFDKEKVDGDARTAGHSLGLYHPAVTSTGENVISTRANNTVVPLTGATSDVTDMPPDRLPYYTTLSGTSMATPETAGVVADILQANGALTPGQVRSVLEVTARPIDGVPFYKQGYGYTDASAAVELALSLAGKPASFVQQTLDTKHAARDAAILSDLSRPAHTAAWNDETEPGPVSVDHTMSVPAGTARFKVVSNGPSTLEVNAVMWDITVTDAKGVQVGATSNFPVPYINSGTAVLDLDLHKLSADPATATKLFNQLNWGTWTVNVTSFDSVGSKELNTVPLLNQFTAKSNLSIVAAAFNAPPVSCLPVPTFVPGTPKTYRLQDDNASGTPWPGDPTYTYVGKLPTGNLANRAPARNLVAAFDEFTTEIPFTPPRFTTPPLSAPLTLGQAAIVETWVQGPSETLGAGMLEAGVVDVSPDGSAKTITSTGGSIAVNTDPAAPAQTKAVIPMAKGYTIAAGHRLGLDLGVLHSQNTVADQLFYDSDKYPTSLTIVPGSIQNISVCGVPGPAKAVGESTGGKVLGSQQTRPAAASGLPPTGRNSPAVLAFALVAMALIVRRMTRRQDGGRECGVRGRMGSTGAQ
ncbi:MAG TPA: S8 family serine peptidase, partial [Acidimicrobiales bacterium]|nr:S8 family serine peptidase [Acidimicrobiales bacterium]